MSNAGYETIFACATPPGRSGVAVIRVSGPAALESYGLLTAGKTLVSHRASVRKLVDPVSRETIDEALVLYFKTPDSYTGEDVIEYQLHGSPAVVTEMLAFLGQCASHRLALPGEFTRRAFENGRMDLTSAEAVADLIDAETKFQKMQALRQMEGALYQAFDRWTKELARVLAWLEAHLDFPEEDDVGDGSSIFEQAIASLSPIEADIEAFLADNHRGERLRDGVRIAVIGAPNAGKSTLVNALAKRDVAIVSEHAGTTRDVIDVHLALNGYPVILSDTAGLRPEQLGETASDQIESEGIRRALAIAGRADMKILMFAATDAAPHKATLDLIDEADICIVSKADCVSARPDWMKMLPGGALFLAVEGDLESLLKTVTAKLETLIGWQETPALTRQRHRDILHEVVSHIEDGKHAPAQELLTEHIRLAIRSLGRLTGRVDVEDLLDMIFSEFCIGK